MERRPSLSLTERMVVVVPVDAPRHGHETAVVGHLAALAEASDPIDVVPLGRQQSALAVSAIRTALADTDRPATPRDLP